jgi:glucose-1-phosphate cytidylyltransferase
MKVILLAGGFGTRLTEYTDVIPKPMVTIGGKPILWHIMQTYSHFGHKDFYVALGYKAEVIKEYFLNYRSLNADFTVDLSSGSVEPHQIDDTDWRVTLVQTGLESMTGGRVKRLQSFIGNEPFMLTYGDGVSDINLHELLKFHQDHGKLMTITSVQPEGRFGSISSTKKGLIEKFEEKPKGDGAWINGGFMVCQPEVLNYIENDQTVFEQNPLNNLAKDNELMGYKHSGFWKPMDTLRDKNQLEKLIKMGKAPWIKW